MAVRKRGKNYYVDYSYGGKRHWITVGPRKKDALDLEAKIRAEIRSGMFFGARDTAIPFEGLAQKYISASRHKRGIETEKYLLAPAVLYFGKQPVGSISVHNIEEYRNERLRTPTRGGDRSNATVNREVAALRRVLSKAVEWKMLRENPVRLKPLEETRGRTRFLTATEIRRLLSSCPAHLRPIVGLALGTGMRRGEILSLGWDDIDWRNRVIYVSNTKNGFHRYVPISPSVKNILTGQARIGDKVFCHEGGRPYHDNRTSFANACKRAGIEGLRFHDLRHTAASHMAMAGVPLRTIGEILGHRTETMTERYSHLTPSHKLDAVGKISGLLMEQEDEA
jgi:integrase